MKSMPELPLVSTAHDAGYSTMYSLTSSFFNPSFLVVSAGADGIKKVPMSNKKLVNMMKDVYGFVANIGFFAQ